MLNLFLAVLALAVFVATCKFLLSKKVFKIVGIIALLCVVISVALWGVIACNEKKEADEHLALLIRYSNAVAQYENKKEITINNIDTVKGISEEDRKELKDMLSKNKNQAFVNTAEISKYAEGWREANKLNFVGAIPDSQSYGKTAIHLDQPLYGVSDVQVVTAYTFMGSYEAAKIVASGVKAGIFRIYSLDGNQVFDPDTSKWTDAKDYQITRFNEAK